MSLTKEEISALRGLTTRLGTDEAAKALRIHKTSVIRALAGLDIRPRTEEDIREALRDGVTDVARGETRANSPTTKRRS